MSRSHAACAALLVVFLLLAACASEPAPEPQLASEQAPAGAVVLAAPGFG